jgi:hypothetical protein
MLTFNSNNVLRLGWVDDGRTEITGAEEQGLCRIIQSIAMEAVMFPVKMHPLKKFLPIQTYLQFPKLWKPIASGIGEQYQIIIANDEPNERLVQTKFY